MPWPPIVRRVRAGAAVLAGLLCVAPPSTAATRPYARFIVADSSLEAALRAPDFEGAWNALRVAELRASVAPRGAALADSAGLFRQLAHRVADAETSTLGSHIAGDALALSLRWDASRRRERVAAGEAESLAVAAQRAIEFDRSDSLFRAALARYRALGERRRTAWVLGSLGVVAFNRGDYASADSIYGEALVARRALGDARMIGNTLNVLGSVNQQLRRYPAAYDYYLEARAVRERIGDPGPLGTTLNYLGVVCRELEHPDSAATYFEQALALTAAAGDSAHVAEVLNNAAALLGPFGDFERADALLRRALANAEERGDLRGQVQAHNIAGINRRMQGRFTEAADEFETAATQAREAADVRTLLEVLLSLGQTWVNLEDPQRARPPLDQALALADSLDDATNQIGALNDLSLVALLEGDTTLAKRRVTQALERATGAGDSSLVHDAAVSLGQMAWQAGDVAGASAWFGRAERSGRARAPDVRAADLIDLALATAPLGRLDDAERACRDALELATSAGVPERAWQALLGVGDVAERRGDMPVALASYRRAASLIDTLRSRQVEERGSIALFASRLFAYDALIHLLGKLDAGAPDSGYSAEAFAWAERARARSYLDRIGAARPAGAMRPTLTLAQVQALLDTDREALLEYSVGDSSTTLWVVKRSSVDRYSLPAARRLRSLVSTLELGLSTAATAEQPRTLNAARHLYQLLIEPASAALRGVDRVVIVPDGPLLGLPFEALLAREVPQRGIPQGDSWWAERVDIAYTPSATVFAAGAGHEVPAGGAIIAVGDPDFGADSAAHGLTRLPSSGAEVTALASLAKGREFVALTGAEAVRERLLALPQLPRAEIIHLATHAQANPQEPARSGLWLAAGRDSEPEFLSVAVIESLELRARLVTLSACKTGLGQRARGEGMIGLSRAFLLAGANSVIASLWSVNDRATALLMQRFYTSLLARRQPPDRALAAARRAMLASPETRSPFHWAPFVLVAQRSALR